MSGLFSKICLRRRFRLMATPYLDGELDAASRLELEAHLKTCAVCRREYETVLFASKAVGRLVFPQAPPSGMPEWSVSNPSAMSSAKAARGRRAWIIGVPATAAAIMAGLLFWLFPYNPRPEPAWDVVRLTGGPRIKAHPMDRTGRLAVGEWLETDAYSRALMMFGPLGQVEVDPNSRLRVIKVRDDENRLILERGHILATIFARPGVFFIDTPAGVAADLGCSYRLQVDEKGNALLQVLFGAVALRLNGRESVVPTGGFCHAAPGVGPGTPYFGESSEKFRRALEVLDFEGGGRAALETILAEAGRGDAPTLLLLMKKVDASDRERLFERLSALVPLPASVSRDGVLKLDAEMLRQWSVRIEEVRAGFADKPFPEAPGSFRITGSLETPRYAHRTTTLADGRVLVTGGLGSIGPNGQQILAGAEIYDPATGTFFSTGALTTPRGLHTATLLPNGKVLVTGGTARVGDDIVLSSAELYDPATGTFSRTGDMAARRAGHQATLLPNGKVLVTGGWMKPGVLDAEAELYDPATGTFSPTGRMNRSRTDHTATLLADGRVLVAGGFTFAETAERAGPSAELYDPKTGRFSPTGNLETDRYKHCAVRLRDGRVLVAAGNANRFSTESDTLKTAELYDPTTGRFEPAGELNLPRFKVRDAAVLLNNGKVLIAGGAPGIELFDPSTRTFSMRIGRLSVHRYYSTADLLPSGEVIVIGGYGGIGVTDHQYAGAAAWIYRPN